jgi:cbb3-type cytochrome oxidase subunit 3
MPLLQVVFTSIFYLFLGAIVYLLYRHAIGAGARARQTIIMLADAALKSAEAAHEAAETAHKLADILEQKHVE